MQSIDTALIKIITTHYYIKRDTIVNKIEYRGKIFFDKFEKINEPLTYNIMKEHEEGKAVIAHSLINAYDKVENIVFDYNGRTPDRFWHKAQLLLREEGFINLLNAKLSQKLPKEWRMFPNIDMPKEFNILTLPYKLYQKERGASWSKYM